MKFLTVLLALVLITALIVSGIFPEFEYIRAVYISGFASATGLQAVVFMTLVKRDEVPQAQA
jgi:hypothetical protein